MDLLVPLRAAIYFKPCRIARAANKKHRRMSRYLSLEPAFPQYLVKELAFYYIQYII